MSVQTPDYSDPSSFMISLNPPHASGDPYSNSVTYVGGKQLGGGGIDPNAVLNKFFGFSGTDTMESAGSVNEVKAFLNGFNIGMQLFNKGLSPEQQIQLQTDTLDPDHPFVPIIMKYVILSDDALKSGDLAGASLNVNAAASTGSATGTQDTKASTEVKGTQNATGTEGAKAVSHKGNPWLAGNAYTQFVVSYFALIAILKEMKAVDSKLELQGMKQVYDLAKQTADTIMAAAKQRAMMHIMEAVVAGVTMAVTIGLTAVSVAQTSKFKIEETGEIHLDADGVETHRTGAFDKEGKEGKPITTAEAVKYNRELTGSKWGTQTIQMGYLAAVQSGGKAMDEVIQAIFELQAAHYDALKELLQAFRTIAQQQMDRASDSFKSESDLITSVIQQLDQMRQKLFEAIAAAMRGKS